MKLFNYPINTEIQIDAGRKMPTVKPNESARNGAVICVHGIPLYATINVITMTHIRIHPNPTAVDLIKP